MGREYLQNNNEKQKKELFMIEMKRKFLFLNSRLKEHESIKDMIDKRKVLINAMRGQYDIEIAILSKNLNDECALATQSSSVCNDCYKNGEKYKKLRLLKLNKEVRQLDIEISNLHRCIQKRHQAACKLRDNIRILHSRLKQHLWKPNNMVYKFKGTH